MQLYTDNIIPVRTERQIFAGQEMAWPVAGQDAVSANGAGTPIYSPVIVGGSMQGVSYRSADNGARFEIFPEDDKNIGCVVYNAAGTVVFKTIVDGTDTGDVIIGDYANGAGAKWDQSASTFTIKGALEASEIHIPDVDTTADSFHVKTTGDTWWGCTETNFDADNDNATAYVLKTGAAKFQSIILDTDVVLADLQAGSALAIQYLTAGTITSKAITLAVAAGTGDAKIQAGKTDFGDTTAGFIMGIDDSDSDKEKLEIGDADYWFKWLGGGDLRVKAKYSNLMLYEAVVDTNGYGDYTTIDAALDAGATRIYVRNGTYSDTLTISTNDTQIIGENIDGVSITGAINVGADDFKISNVYIALSINFNDATNCAVDGCSVKLITMGGSDAYNRIRINNCNLRSSLTANIITITPRTDSSDIIISNNVFSKSSATGDTTAIKISVPQASSGTFNMNLMIINNQVTTENDIYIFVSFGMASTGNTQLVKNILIDGNLIAGTSSTAFTFGSNNAAATGEDLNITNNIIKDINVSGAVYCILTSARWSRVTVANNDISNITSSGSTATGIAVLGADSQVSNNTIDTCTSYGIYTGDKVAITGNIVDNCNLGIECANWCTVSGNISHDHTLSGIRHNGDDQAVITGNVCYANGTDGIHLDGRGDMAVGNICNGNTSDGIQIDQNPADKCLVNSNMCKNNGGYGINWANADPTNSTCVGNVLEDNTTGELNGAAGAGSEFANNVD